MRSVARAFVALLAAAMPISATAQPLPQIVLVLDQGTANTPTAQAIGRSFQSELDALSGTSVYVYLERLGVSVFGGPHYPDLLLGYFREKYRGKPLGVIVARGTAALPYALRLRDELWPRRPSWTSIALVLKRAIVRSLIPFCSGTSTPLTIEVSSVTPSLITK